jgi:hypothetical protein
MAALFKKNSIVIMVKSNMGKTTDIRRRFCLTSKQQ